MTPCAFSQAASRMKSERFLPNVCAALSMRSRCSTRTRRLIALFRTTVFLAPCGLRSIQMISGRSDSPVESLTARSQWPTACTSFHRHTRNVDAHSTGQWLIVNCIYNRPIHRCWLSLAVALQGFRPVTGRKIRIPISLSPDAPSSIRSFSGRVRLTLRRLDDSLDRQEQGHGRIGQPHEPIVPIEFNRRLVLGIDQRNLDRHHR